MLHRLGSRGVSLRFTLPYRYLNCASVILPPSLGASPYKIAGLLDFTFTITVITVRKTNKVRKTRPGHTSGSMLRRLCCILVVACSGVLLTIAQATSALVSTHSPDQDPLPEHEPDSR